MLLLEQILDWDDEQLCALVIIRRSMPMVDERGLPAWVGLELMAQATAALAGCRAQQKQQPVQMGFLVGTRRYHASCSYFPLGARLEVRVRQTLHGDNGLGVFDCTLAGTGEHSAITAGASINIFQPDNPEQFIQGTTP
ncbi:MAG: hypothetical protein B0W54_14045 [Cellvibrio sp. 79]|nr:MAG: hypothetical protein B0W54_14045 [Cellvibrio sp. 79]